MLRERSARSLDAADEDNPDERGRSDGQQGRDTEEVQAGVRRPE